MINKFIVFGAGLAMLTNIVSAQSNGPESAVTPTDLGIQSVGLLPDSPLYFLKEWGRGLRKVLTFNAISRARLELDILNQRAAEIQKLSEIKPAAEQALTKALQNYQDNLARLKSRLENLSSLSRNSRLNDLLDKLAERGLRHNQLFQELIVKHQNLAERLRQAKNELSNRLRQAGEDLDDPEKFGERIRKAFESERQEMSRTLNARQVLSDLVNRLPSQASEKIREIIIKLESKFGTSTATSTPISDKGKPVSPNVPGERKVEILDSGFSPKELKIIKGDTVTWVNKSVSAAWPASAVHPTHKVYPESGIEKCGTAEASSIFDACRGLQTNEFWSFTFNVVGSWKYHDHLNVSHFATIKVEEK